MVSEPSSEYFISEDPEEYAEELEERDYYMQDNVFWVPQEARWETLRSKAKQPDIGFLVDDAMTLIENENTSLRGKLDKRFGRAQLGEGILGELIDLISTIGFADKYDSSDLLGEVYEYFLGQSASELMGEEVLVEMAREVAKKLRDNLTVDWAVRDSVRAKLRILIRTLLRKYKYPPNQQKDAIEMVLRQAEVISEVTLAA